MTYDQIIDVLVAEREHLFPSRSALARRLGLTHQGLKQWEEKRRKVHIDDLRRWSAELGYRLVVDLVSASKRRAPSELEAVLLPLSREQTDDVLRLASLLGKLEAGDQALLRAIVVEFERKIPQSARSGTSKSA